MSESRPTRGCIVLAVLLVASTVAVPTTATATADGSFFDGLVADESRVTIPQKVGNFVMGLTSWVARQKAALGDDPGNATRYANEFQSEFNTQNATIEAYASARLNASAAHDVYRLNFTDREGNVVTRYLVSDVRNGSWQNVRVVTPTRFQQLNRSVDHWVAFDWYQSRNAASELDQFVDEYARPNRDLTKGYRASMLAKYGAPTSDLWTNRSDS